ncbi:MAG: class I SAM-dependent methyltransferase [Nocardioidaceae bacterium]
MTEPHRDEALHARRARSFGATARAYAENRPDYAVDAIRWGLEGAGREVTAALDLAAGTGKLTAGLVALGLNVTAVEPDPEMLAELRRLLPKVPAMTGTAEAVPLPDASTDAVFVGQAFHWFDKVRALAEIGRVLRPGGVLVALWNQDDSSVPWVVEFSRSMRTSASLSGTSNDEPLPVHDLFDAFEESPRFAHSHRRTADSLVATFSTHSHMLVAPEEERLAKQRTARAFLAANPETESGEFLWPLVTEAFRARRRE